LTQLLPKGRREIDEPVHWTTLRLAVIQMVSHYNQKMGCEHLGNYALGKGKSHAF